MKELKDHSIDLIYLDPPFNSKRNYNIVYKNTTGREVPEEVEAFCDTWTMDAEKQDLLNNMAMTMKNHEVDAGFVCLWIQWMKSLKKTRRDLTAYLLYMTVRLLEMRRVLKDTGSIYLHCDPHASHYIKVLMDGIFEHKHFRNEIVWHYPSMSKTRKHFPRKHDIILRYTKSDRFVFNWKDILVPYKESSLKRAKYGKAGFGKNATATGNFLTKEGKVPDTVWDIPHIKSKKESLGYPTQKPKRLLERIIQASCPEGGVVLDPFCGCGTTLYATQELNMQKTHDVNRTWIGMDIAILSTQLVKSQLETKYELVEGRDFGISGIPVSVQQAKDLWEKDPFQFQNWAIEYVEGFCTSKKTRDGGVDGRIYFRVREEGRDELKSMIISVKGGKLKLDDVRALSGTMDKEGVVFGGIISFREPTSDMKDLQVEKGSYKGYPRLQFLTVKQMLEGSKDLFDLPNMSNRKSIRKNPQNPIKYEVNTN